MRPRIFAEHQIQSWRDGGKGWGMRFFLSWGIFFFAVLAAATPPPEQQTKTRPSQTAKICKLQAPEKPKQQKRPDNSNKTNLPCAWVMVCKACAIISKHCRLPRRLFGCACRRPGSPCLARGDWLSRLSHPKIVWSLKAFIVLGCSGRPAHECASATIKRMQVANEHSPVGGQAEEMLPHRVPSQQPGQASA